MAGTTPNYAWPYPTGTDGPPNVATAIQNAMTAADATLFGQASAQTTFNSGFATVTAAIGRAAAISNTNTTGSIAVATPTNIPGTSSFSFTKKLAATKLIVAIGLVTDSTAVDTILGLGTLIAGVDTTITQFRHTSASEYRQAFGINQITGVAAGAQTIQARWFRVSGAGTLGVASGVTWLTMACFEVPT